LVSSHRANITSGELADLKKLAKTIFAMTDACLDRLAKSGNLFEIKEVR
jgi:hypothetical protein